MTALRPLILLGVILTASGLAAEQLGPIVGPAEYNGYLVFDYPEGDNPITNIVFNVDPWVSECLLIVNVPAPWSYTYSDPILTLSGGSLNPGGSVSVTVSLDDYFEKGEYQVTSVGTTSAGEVSNAIGPLLVGDLYLLQVISLANTYQTPLLGSVIGLIALELMFWQRNRPFRDIIPPVKEVNDFVRDSEKILSKEGTEKIKDAVDKTDSDSDLEHKSVLPDLAPYDGSAPIDRTKKELPNIDDSPTEPRKDTGYPPGSPVPPGTDPAKYYDDLMKEGAPSDPYYGFMHPDAPAKDPVDIAHALGRRLSQDTEKSIPDTPSPTEIDDSDFSALDDLPGPEPDYDDNDLPEIDKVPEPEPEDDDSDLPGLDDTPKTNKETTDKDDK